MNYEHLIGREFQMGYADCLALASDFYRENYGILIADYARPRDWASGELDLASFIARREGFEKLTEWTLSQLHPGDILCMTIGEGNANHVAVYLGNREILHHLSNRLSRVDPLNRIWESSISYILRHPRVTFDRESVPQLTLMEVLRDRYTPTA